MNTLHPSRRLLTPTMPEKIINWEQAMEQVGGDREFLDEVLQDLLAEARTAEEEISTAIEDRDFSQIMKAAHRIKGSASYLCCDALKQSSFKLQEAGHAGTQSNDNEEYLINQIKDLFDEFEFCLKDLRGEVSSSK